MIKTNLIKISPVCCMDQERQALDFALSNISTGEPSAIVSIDGMGKRIIYQQLISQLGANDLPYLLRSIHATSSEELKESWQNIKKLSDPMLCVFNLSTEEDVSWVIQELDDMRKKRGTSFNCLILSNIGCVSEAWEKKIKILIRSTFLLKPVTLKDATSLIKSFESRFNFSLTEKQQNEIYYLSGGHVGLIKSLFLLLKENPNVVLEAETLLNEESICYRIQACLNDIGYDRLQSLIKNHNSDTQAFFERFGLVVSSEFISPLFPAFLKRLSRNYKNSQLIAFTKQEKEVFELLNRNKNSLISREDIAKVIWQDEWEEKYSDWALDALMHRLRLKVVNMSFEGKLETKKGLGFVYICP